jgi:hypothetical protein
MTIEIKIHHEEIMKAILRGSHVHSIYLDELKPIDDKEKVLLT